MGRSPIFGSLVRGGNSGAAAGQVPACYATAVPGTSAALTTKGPLPALEQSSVELGG